MSEIIITIAFIIVIYVFFFQGKNKKPVNKIILKENDQIIADNVRCAYLTFQRMVGLLNTPSINKGEALIIDPCKAIHMKFMGFSIDAVFIDKKGEIVAIYEDLEPQKKYRVFRPGNKAKAVIELPLSTVKKHELKLGQILEFIYDE
ncbi:MAG: DUF192 domain-containing protein [Pseudomonadota bacterium]